MSILGIMQKTRASEVSRFNFGGPFLDDKSDFLITNFQFCWILAKNINFSKSSDGLNFNDRGLWFWILVLYIQDKIPVEKYPPIAIYPPPFNLFRLLKTPIWKRLIGEENSFIRILIKRTIKENTNILFILWKFEEEDERKVNLMPTITSDTCSN